MMSIDFTLLCRIEWIEYSRLYRDSQISQPKQGCGLDLAITFLYDVFLIQTSGKREWQVGVNKVSARDEVDSAVPEIPVRIL